MSSDFLPTQLHIDLFAKGYDSSGQSPLTFIGAEINAKAATANESAVASTSILSGDIVNNLRVQGTIFVNDGDNDRVLIGEGIGLF